jgi:hypothetical protein
LNRLKVPAPGAAYQRKSRPSYYGTWSASVLHGDLRHATGLLNNPVYIGRVIWNRRQWVVDPETNRRTPKLRPESEWIETAQPALRIVAQPVWEAAQVRRRGQQQRQVRLGRGPKFLLSGLLTCGVCGANFVKADYYRYVCASHLNRQTCPNALRVPQRVAEVRLLAGIKQDLFCKDGLAVFIKETTRLLAERTRQRRPELERLRRRLAEVERELANIMTAIKKGCLTVTTKGELEKAERERVRLEEAIKTNAVTVDKVATLLPRAAERYAALVQDLGPLSLTHMAQARERIRTLVGAIKLMPTATLKRSSWEAMQGC